MAEKDEKLIRKTKKVCERTETRIRTKQGLNVGNIYNYERCQTGIFV